ncbi:MAG TPA: 7-cyano-7-deazaguanine synthase [Tepidisphaeraceae bacterium]|jgi:7-cyano-7-deazaguanine synthase
MAKDVAIVLNSGSLNSAVVTALAAQRFRPILMHAVTAGQASDDEAEATGSRRRSAFEQQVAHFKPYREHIVPMPFLSQIRPGGAKAHSVPPEFQPQAPISAVALELLPLMATAGRFASHYGAAAIYLGLRVGGAIDDLAQATEYVQIWADLLQLACGLPEVEVQAPLLELDPWQVVDLGLQVNAPLDRTWSCDGAGDEPCWACRGCKERESAFQRSAKPDPIRATRR